MVASVVVEVRGPLSAEILNYINSDAKAIEIGQNAGECDQPAIAGVVSRFGGNDPTGEKMSERGHEGGKGYMSYIVTRGKEIRNQAEIRK